jgi:hypothetical protein
MSSGIESRQGRYRPTLVATTDNRIAAAGSLTDRLLTEKILTSRDLPLTG